MLLLCNSVSYLLGVFFMILPLRSFKSVSILLNTSANCGLEFCMRLLDARAMLSASRSIATSVLLNMMFILFLCTGCARLEITADGMSMSTGFHGKNENKLPSRSDPARRAQSPSLRSP